ncbi:MAG: ComEC/Rec2 family competence protein [Bacteroidota bacterium]
MSKHETPLPPPPAWGLVPLVPVVVACGLGIWTADRLGYQPPTYWLLAAGITGLSATLTVLFRSALRWPSRLGSLLILLTCFFLAGWRTHAGYLPAKADFFATQAQAGDLLAGRIESIRPGQKNLRLEVSVAHLLNDSTGDRSVRGGLLVYLPPTLAAGQLRAGDELVFRGQIRPLRPPPNPYVFDLSAYWARQGIYHQVFLRTDTDWETSGRKGSGLAATAARWRRAWFRTFQEHLTGDELAVAAALVMGKRDGISQEVKSAYADTGAIHVLAVSGLHVGIIFLIVRTLFGRVFRLEKSRGGRIALALISTLAVWVFALVSGFSTSVFRAAIMFTVVAVAGLGKRRVDIFNTLAVAALIILWRDPQELFQVGFQLSFTAIIGIVLFTRKFNQLVYWPARILRSAWSAMAASTGAQLGTLPLSLYHFGRFPTYFLLSGTVVIISAFAAMFSGLLHGLVAVLFPAVGSLTGALLGGIIQLQNAFIFYFQRLPYALLEVQHFGWQPALSLAVAIGALAVGWRWRQRWAFLLSGLALTACIIWARAQVPGEDQASSLLVYHVSRGTLVDVIPADGKAFAFGEEPTPADLPWTAGPRREALGYQPEVTLPLAGVDTLIHFGAHRISVLGGANSVKDPSVPDAATHVLVINNFRPERMPEVSRAVTLVVDGSNPYYRFKAWRELAEERKFSVWLTGEDGAFSLR